MSAGDYHRQFIEAIREISAILKSEVEFREIDEKECYLKAVITFAGGYTLQMAEYAEIEGDQVRRLKYRHQLLDAAKNPISRWDNAPHHKQVRTFPHHRHDDQGHVHPSREITLSDAIAIALELIGTKSDSF